MKYLLIAISILVPFVHTGLQAQKPSFCKTWSFVKHESRGNIIGDENGQSVDNGQITKYLIYVETTTKNLLPVKRLMVDGQTFKTSAFRIAQTPVLAGLRISDEAKVFVKVAKGHYLWMLECTNLIPNAMLPIAYKKQLNKGQVLLLSEVAGKIYYLPIAVPTELQGDIYM